MRPDRASETAEFTAALRADHLLHDEPVVFADRWALQLLAPGMRARVESGELARLMRGQHLRPTQGHVVVRARRADDALREALARGVEQLLVLGAGLDSSCLRRPSGLRVIELDHPASQRVKRERLAALPGVDLDGVQLAPADLERTPLERALATTVLDAERPAFVIWLGVTMYLAPQLSLRTLGALRTALRPGSEVVLDYPVPVETLSAEFRAIAAAKNADLERRGEPRIAAFDPDALHVSLRELGWDVVDDADAAELDTRYLSGRADDLRANPEHRIAVLRAF